MTRKTAFFESRSWFKFNNLGLALGMNWNFYTSVAKGLKLKVRKFFGLVPMFVEVTGEKTAGDFWLPSILNSVNMQPTNKIFKKILEDNSFATLIKSNTCFTSKPGSCIAMILTNKLKCFQYSGVMETGVSGQHALNSHF